MWSGRRLPKFFDSVHHIVHAIACHHRSSWRTCTSDEYVQNIWWVWNLSIWSYTWSLQSRSKQIVRIPGWSPVIFIIPYDHLWCPWLSQNVHDCRWVEVKMVGDRSRWLESRESRHIMGSHSCEQRPHRYKSHLFISTTNLTSSTTVC